MAAPHGWRRGCSIGNRDGGSAPACAGLGRGVGSGAVAVGADGAPVAGDASVLHLLEMDHRSASLQ